MTDVFVRKRREDREKSRRSRMEKEAEIGTVLLQAKEHLESLRVGEERKGYTLEFPEGAPSC